MRSRGEWFFRQAARVGIVLSIVMLIGGLMALPPGSAFGDDNPGTGIEGPPSETLDAGVVEPESSENESNTTEETPGQNDNTTNEGTGDGNDINFQQLPDSSFIYDTAISALAGADSYYNNQIVQVTGEVIGDRINAEFDPDYCWITLQATDGSSAQVIVYVNKEQTSGIDSYGAYGRRGTTIQVRGTYYLVCPDHEGISDIHSDNVSVVSAGQVIETPFRWSIFVPGLILVLVGAALVVFYRYLQERQR